MATSSLVGLSIKKTEAWNARWRGNSVLSEHRAER